jgi:alkylhydroperoxidase/carboxymuconolactone decarboxylase family protein YurZ
MTSEERPRGVAYLASYCEPAAAAHEALRKAVLSSGPLDLQTCELIVLAGFVVTGVEFSFKAHARRLLSHGTSKDALRQAVLVTFGSTAPFPAVIQALRWIDELDDQS